MQLYLVTDTTTHQTFYLSNAKMRNELYNLIPNACTAEATLDSDRIMKVIKRSNEYNDLGYKIYKASFTEREAYLVKNGFYETYNLYNVYCSAHWYYVKENSFKGLAQHLKNQRHERIYLFFVAKEEEKLEVMYSIWKYLKDNNFLIPESDASKKLDALIAEYPELKCRLK